MSKIQEVAALVLRNEQELPSRIEQYDAKATELIELGSVLQEVESEKVAGEAADVAKMLRELHKEIETTREAAVRPLNQVVKQINGNLKGIQGDLDQETNRLKALVLSFTLAEKRKVEEAERKAREQAEAFDRARAEDLAKGGVSDEDIEDDRAQRQSDREAVEELSSVPRRRKGGGFGTIHTTTTWGFEVTDLAEIPREYLIVDEKRLAICAKTTRPEIPGVKWVQKTGAALR